MTAMFVTILCACVGSSGLWACVQAGVQTRRQKKEKKDEGKDAAERLLMGLAYAKIVDLCLKYISRGWITNAEYEDLNHYIFEPYEDKGGDGTAKHMMEQVRELPVREVTR